VGEFFERIDRALAQAADHEFRHTERRLAAMLGDLRKENGEAQ